MHALIENFINVLYIICILVGSIPVRGIQNIADVFRINKAFSLCKVVANDDDFCLIILVCK